MRLHLLSDLHLETRGEKWAELVAGIPSDLGDVLVLAGDILNLFNEARAADMMGTLAEKADETVWVLGNHEHYNDLFQNTKAIARRVAADTGIHLLDGNDARIGGVRFLGATLWFAFQQEAQRHRFKLTDFHTIDDLEAHVYQDHARAVSFLSASTQPGDVVITHHLPSHNSVPPNFRLPPYAELNPFFVADCESIIEQRKPALWMHGHTHSACDYRLFETRIACNPIGYPRERVKGRLDFTLDVPT